MNQTSTQGNGAISVLSISPELRQQYADVLCDSALGLLGDLVARFDEQRITLLEARRKRQARFDAGELPDFDPDTADIRESDWTVAPIPGDLQDRRVEITGPVDRKMVINALNSGACVFMADFEDASAPSITNMLDGQRNLRDANRREIDFVSPHGKHYQLSDTPATLLVRPRGLHLPEAHVQYKGRAIGGSLFDFALYLFHNHAQLKQNGTGPYFYLPKLESHHEAAWWNSVIDAAEDMLGLQRGTVRVTVLIETLPAAFCMDEILHALREHIVGLNCGRWDYIFSYIKVLRHHPDRVLPDRAQVTMDRGFLRAYSQLLIQTCHRREAFAMGGMAAQIPVKNDGEANAAAIEKVRNDKLREVRDGHDGTWVAHPALVKIARDIFDEHMSGQNQLDRKRHDIHVERMDLLEPQDGNITMDGLRGNIAVGIQYLAAWLSGHGCVPINNLMEDAATAEIARAQLWQWCRHPAGKLEDGTDITLDRILRVKDEVLAELLAKAEDAQKPKLREAAELIADTVRENDFIDFITLPAYSRITEED
jgi:malate synthase